MNLEQELLTYILKEHLPGEAPDSLKPDDDLIGSGILDSLAMINLATHLETHYGSRGDEPRQFRLSERAREIRRRQTGGRVKAGGS